MMTIPELLREHVALYLECVDCVYLNGYVTKLQSSDGLMYFKEHRRGQMIASPALLGETTQTFGAELEVFAQRAQVPIVHFQRGQCRDEVVARYQRSFTKPEGVVFIGVAQEKMTGFKARKETQEKAVRFQFSMQSVFVRTYYFYLHDAKLRPAFIKIGAYTPYPVKLYLNGHEWAKQQLRGAEIAFEALDNSFLSYDDPKRLPTLCQQLGSAVNRRLLETERASQDCLLSAEGPARLSEPTLTATGQRAPRLRFEQPRVMALFAALSRFAPSLNGIRHADVREIVPSFLGIVPEAHTASQMRYDLRRLRLKGLITRIEGTHTYTILVS
jgi:hypothetical protein